MRSSIILMGLGLPLVFGACAHTPGGLSPDTSQQLAADPAYAHNSSGEIILGPSTVDQLVIGNPDAGGNVHVMTDAYFVANALAFARADRALGELVQARAVSPDVRALGQRLADDRTQLIAQLNAVALKRGLPTNTTTLAPPDLKLVPPDMFDHEAMTAVALADERLANLCNEEATVSGDRLLRLTASDHVARLRASAAAARDAARM